MTERLNDLVCGMPVDPSTAHWVEHGGERLAFCSSLCSTAFRWNPEAYLRRARAGSITQGKARVAYFTMEAALDSRMPTYSGGLGVLAGDTLRSFADLRLPAVGVCLVHRCGYFSQVLDQDGRQSERPDNWRPELSLRPATATATVQLCGRSVRVRAWRYDVVGTTGWVVPVFLLDTDVEENADSDRRLTDWLYGGDDGYRLAQEVVLGVGGLRLLRALGLVELEKLHLNEGHAALAAVELLRETSSGDTRDFHAVRDRCVFTTHTPVAAGHDQFDYGLAWSVLGDLVPRDVLQMLGGQERLNMTRIALALSGRVNGVARRHGEVSREMFPGYEIGSVTNGVHSATWTSAPFQALFDRFVPAWRDDPALLRQAASIPISEVMQAHQLAKRKLLEVVRERAGRELEPRALTIGFARRATPYKRAHLVLSDVNRLRTLARIGPLQLVFAGKAHPRDGGGKDVIQHIVRLAHELAPVVPLVFLENYDFGLAKTIVSGVDLWLNTPLRPLEASGTSGMKAAHNGVPSLSVLDGWWIEGHVEGVTGWSIGGTAQVASTDVDARDAEDLYAKLALVLEIFHNEPERWASMMRMTIALNASYFNTHRMVHQYAAAYMT